MYKFFDYNFITVAYIPVQDNLPTTSFIYGYYFIWQPLVVTSHHAQYNKWAGRKWWLLVVTNNSVPLHYDITFSCSNTVASSNDGIQRKHHIV